MTTLASPRISYDELGSGGPALLFLPGWCGGREVCSPICCPRVAQSRRAVALDWRGHGQSERSDSDFGTAELVADALGVIDRLGLGADRSRRAVTPAGSPSSCGAASARRACPASRSSTG
ncbi:MAG: alpha/beta hydrolase [Euzebyaceae bacterium]|nr:alpha/beta hydrolase [Euzebyaceae bacterium]